MLHVYINNFNRLDYLLKILIEFDRFNSVTPIFVHIVDNGSTLPGLLEWYDSKGYLKLALNYSVEIHRLTNGGPRGFMRCLVDSEFYIACDSDIDFSPCPDDLFAVMIKGLVDNPTVKKTGPSIRIDDVPLEHPFYQRIQETEGQYWKNRHDDNWWSGALDTTCFVCRNADGFHYEPALRADSPYIVRHLPYYYIPGKLTEEEIYYFENLPPTYKSGIYWSTLMQDSGKFKPRDNN
jgi:hypothetical protein